MAATWEHARHGYVTGVRHSSGRVLREAELLPFLHQALRRGLHSGKRDAVSSRRREEVGKDVLCGRLPVIKCLKGSRNSDVQY